MYPCADCGVLRTKAEGGTTFTVCDPCWDKRRAAPPSEDTVTRARRLVGDCTVTANGVHQRDEHGACMHCGKPSPSDGEPDDPYAHLNCPACGGSGHVDDTRSPSSGGERGPWRPIETAPRDGTQVLVSGVGLRRWISTAHYKHGWQDDDGRGVLARVDFWMPLPPMPLSTGGDEPSEEER